MEIEQHVWGMTPEGEAVILYILRNASGAEVRLSTYGATVVSVRVPDRTGHIDHVALGYGCYEHYIGDPASLGKTLGRCAGTVRYATTEIEGQSVRLYPNYGPHHRNGGPKGFGDRLWEARAEGNRVVMSLTSEDGDQSYPGTLEVEAIFDFDDDNTLEVTYQAYSDRPTIVNLACNLCLNLSGVAAALHTVNPSESPRAMTPPIEGLTSADIGGHELRLRASTLFDLDEQAIPLDHTSDVAGTSSDFTAWRAIGEAGCSSVGGSAHRTFGMPGGSERLYPLDGWQPNILTEAGELREPHSGRCVRVLTSQPCIALATAIRPSQPRLGLPSADCTGVALLCCAHPGMQQTLLRPKELYIQKTVYRFGTL